MASVEVSDFSGGMTDNYVNAAPNKYQSAENMAIRPDRRLESRYGCEILSDTSYQLPFTSTAKRVDSITKFKGTRFYQTQNKFYYDGGASFTEIVGPAAASMFSSSVVQTNQNSYAEWNNHLFVTNDLRVRPVFQYLNSTTWNLFTLGLPPVTSAEVATVAFSAGSGASRNYVFVRAHTYTINGVEFTQRSAVSALKNYTGAITNSITGLPVLANSGNTHYATSAIKLEIYRTTDANSVYYKAGEVTNGTTTFSDTVSDTDLLLNAPLYTEGDELDYDQPPECKYVIQNDGVLFFLNIKDSLADIHPNMIVQANPDQPYAAPGGNTATVDGDLTGGGVAGQFPVVFTEKRTYRLQGIYDSTGGGGITPVEISRTVGCISHKSIVQTQDGLFFAAKDGFYFTDGYKVLRISEDLPQTYRTLVETEAQAKRIYGTYNPADKRVKWACTSDSEGTENDCIFVAYLYFGIRPDTPFTKWSGGVWPTAFNPTALFYDEDDNYLYRGEKAGYVLYHTSDQVNDFKVDSTTTPDNWVRVPVIYDFKSIATNFGSVSKRKWVTRLIVYADAVGKVTMRPSSQNDNTQVWVEMAEVRAGTPLIWGDTDVLWGDSSIRWNFVPIVSANRRFPKQSVRCSYKQIRLQNSLTTIEETETMGQAVFDGVSKTVTLVDGDVTWAANALDYFVTSASDDYERRYRITARTDTELTVEDLDNTLPSGTLDFRIVGYRLDESIRLLSFSLIYEPITSSQTPFRAS